MRGGERPVVDEGARRPLAGARADRVQHAVDGLAEEQRVRFLDRQLEAELARELGLDAAGKVLAVDEHAIAVEDQRGPCVAQARLNSCRAAG
jgi:hypothetical protein